MENTKRCSVRPSNHAADQLVERGITEYELFEAFVRGAKRAIGVKILCEYKGIEVVYKQFPCNYFVITVYHKTR